MLAWLVFGDMYMLWVYGVETEVIEPWKAGVCVIALGVVVFVVLAYVTKKGQDGDK